MSQLGSRARGAIGLLAAWLIRALGATWRVRTEGRNPLIGNRDAQIGAMWHRDGIVAAWWFRDLGISTPVSRSADGDLVAPIVVALGYGELPRGSSSRGGGAALRGLVRSLEAGASAGILIDGPHGPARQSKLGIVSLARLTGTPITPIAFGASRALRFNSWDGTILPLPFARVVARFGEPICVPREATPDDEAALREEVDARFNSLTDALDAEFAR